MNLTWLKAWEALWLTYETQSRSSNNSVLLLFLQNSIRSHDGCRQKKCSNVTKKSISFLMTGFSSVATKGNLRSWYSCWEILRTGCSDYCAIKRFHYFFLCSIAFWWCNLAVTIYQKQLSKDAKIIAAPKFENAVVKILNKSANCLQLKK